MKNPKDTYQVHDEVLADVKCVVNIDLTSLGVQTGLSTSRIEKMIAEEIYSMFSAFSDADSSIEAVSVSVNLLPKSITSKSVRQNNEGKQ